MRVFPDAEGLVGFRRKRIPALQAMLLQSHPRGGHCAETTPPVKSLLDRGAPGKFHHGSPVHSGAASRHPPQAQTAALSQVAMDFRHCQGPAGATEGLGVRTLEAPLGGLSAQGRGQASPQGRCVHPRVQVCPEPGSQRQFPRSGEPREGCLLVDTEASVTS